jgi:hypothetical protein
MNSYRKALGDADIDWVNDTINVAFLGSGHSINVDTQDVWGDISANEVTGTNWPAGGVALTSKTVVQNDTSNRGDCGAADVSVANVTLTGAEYIAVYKVAATAQLICQFDLPSTKNYANETVEINWANGLVVTI